MKCALKYAPRNLDEVIYPSIGTERRIKAYGDGELEGHVMLYGPNGTGKTTVAKLLVETIGGVDAMVEKDSAEQLLNKSDLRFYLMQAGSTARFTQSAKYFLLLNEFDNTKKGVDKLWTALDDCGDTVMAIITTNEPMGIHKSVRSRFELIEMPALNASAVLGRVQIILNAEGLSLPNSQVLHYLKQREFRSDIREYMRCADELLYLHRNNMPFPVWTQSAPTLKVV